MRIAERDQLNLMLPRTVELTPGTDEILSSDPERPPRQFKPQCGLNAVGFRCATDYVEHRRSRCRAESSPECFQGIEIRPQSLETANDWNLTATKQTNLIAEQRIEGVVELLGRLNVDAQRGHAPLI